MSPPEILVSPSLDDVQAAVSKAVVAILCTSKSVREWGREGRQGITFHSRVTKDIEIVRMVLLLTGGVMGTRNEVQKFLKTFSKYDWLWQTSKAKAYEDFLKTTPELDDYDKELKRFQVVEREIEALPSSQTIGPLVLDNTKIKVRSKIEKLKNVVNCVHYTRIVIIVKNYFYQFIPLLLSFSIIIPFKQTQTVYTNLF